MKQRAHVQRARCAASASVVILAAPLATVALASALGPLAGPGGGVQAFADHDRDESAPRSFSVAVTVFRAAGLVQLARTAGPPPHG